MSNSKRILVVDDDAMVATVISLMLKELGYESVVKESPQEAIDAFQATPAEYSVVITDLTMPEINGVQLAGILKELRSDIPVLVMSGYTGAAADIPDTDQVDRFLSKPLLMDELGSALDSLCP